MDEGMKKAYEDTELLKSIVVPLEEQIGALKDKLRETDGLLREQARRKKNTLIRFRSVFFCSSDEQHFDYFPVLATNTCLILT